MKKVLITLSVVLFAVALMYGAANAGVTGSICSVCHTMHNSQNGTPMGDTATPQERLLRAGCVACHTDDTGMTSDYGAPAVLHTTNPSGQGNGKTNAGGDFYWVADAYGDTDNAGHNVKELSTTDAAIYANLNYAPPGFDGTVGQATAGTVGGGTFDSQLTCAGTFGCHGDHDDSGGDLDSWAGIKGAHHSNTDGSAHVSDDATTIGNSYRFLYGIKGMENVDWNWNETASSHNEYLGEDSPSSREDPNTGDAYMTNEDTISFLCAECHGLFHNSIDGDSTAGSPWVRHPTDIALPNSGEYDDYNSDNGDNTAGSYSVEAPVARSTVYSSSNSTVTPGTDIVMCLSCHRAHGSDQADLLRWAYSGMDAGGGNTNGCFTCHTEKN